MNSHALSCVPLTARIPEVCLAEERPSKERYEPPEKFAKSAESPAGQVVRHCRLPGADQFATNHTRGIDANPISCRVHRKRQRLPSNGPIESAPAPGLRLIPTFSCRGAPDRVLPFGGIRQKGALLPVAGLDGSACGKTGRAHAAALTFAWQHSECHQRKSQTRARVVSMVQRGSGRGER